MKNPGKWIIFCGLCIGKYREEGRFFGKYVYTKKDHVEILFIKIEQKHEEQIQTWLEKMDISEKK